MSYSRRTAPRRVRACSCLWWLLISALGFGSSLAAIQGAREGTRVLLLLVPFTASLGCLAARTALRVLRSGVTITGETVVIFGPVRTRHVPLAEAENFVPGVGTGGRQPTISLGRGRQPSVAVWAPTRSGFVWSLRRVVDAFRQLAAELTIKRLVESLEPLAAELNASLVAAKQGNDQLVTLRTAEGISHTPAAYGRAEHLLVNFSGAGDSALQER